MVGAVVGFYLLSIVHGKLKQFFGKLFGSNNGAVNAQQQNIAGMRRGFLNGSAGVVAPSSGGAATTGSATASSTTSGGAAGDTGMAASRRRFLEQQEEAQQA